MEKNTKTSLFSKGFYNNPENRAVIYQIITLVIVVILAYYFANNMFANIEKRGISTGFSFLNEIAGFGISQSLVEYSDSTSTYGRVFY